MRRQLLLASVGAITIAGSAFAAEPLPPPPPPIPIFTWTGLYAGLQVGYAWDQDPVTVTLTTPTTFPLIDSLGSSPKGVIGGAHIGYNLQINQWLIGLEGTVDGTSVHTIVFDPLITLATADTRSDVQGSIRLRLGIVFDRVLLYATGGAAFAGITTFYTQQVLPLLQETDGKTRSGWTVGGGIAYALTNNWSIRAEYRYSDFGHLVDYPFAAVVTSPFDLLSVQHHLTQHQVQFGISYKFDTMAPVVAKY